MFAKCNIISGNELGWGVIQSRRQDTAANDTQPEVLGANKQENMLVKKRFFFFKQRNKKISLYLLELWVSQ